MERGDNIPAGKGLLEQMMESEKQYVNMNPTAAEWKAMWKDIEKQFRKPWVRPRAQIYLSKGYIESLTDQEFASLLHWDVEAMMGMDAILAFNSRKNLHDVRKAQIKPATVRVEKRSSKNPHIINSQPWRNRGGRR